MKKVKLSTLHDGTTFMCSKKTKVEYTVTKKVKGGVMVTAVKSQLTFVKKGKTIVFI